jgi:hypothetical protein
VDDLAYIGAQVQLDVEMFALGDPRSPGIPRIRRRNPPRRKCGRLRGHRAPPRELAAIVRTFGNTKFVADEAPRQRSKNVRGNVQSS